MEQTPEHIRELSCTGDCKATTKAGARCTNTAKYDGYCGCHNYLRFSTSRSPARRAKMSMEASLKKAAKKLYSQSKSNATRRQIEHSITVGELEKLMLKSGGKCAVTRVPFDFSEVARGKRRPHYPSVDRVDNSKGYILGNIRIVTAFANLAMNEWGSEPLHRAAYELARIILARSQNTPSEAKGLASEQCGDKSLI